MKPILPSARQDQSKIRRAARTPSGSKTEAARALLRPLVEAKLPVDRAKLAREHDIGEHIIQNADIFERGRLQGREELLAEQPTLFDPSLLSRSAQDRLAAYERRVRAQLEAAFDTAVSQRVQHHIEEYLMPHYKERLEKAELLLKVGRPFTNRQFLSLLAAVHPDSTNPDNRNAAFILLKEKEIVLRPEEKDRPLSGGLPTTVAELLARKKTKTV